jgi:protein SCO1/2
MSRFKLFAGALIAGVALVGLVVAAYLALRPRLTPTSFHGQWIDSASPASDFVLQTAGSRSVSLSDFRGRVVLLFFGYRFCPDVCPLTLYEMKQMMEALGPDGERVQVIMVSVDPERDPPDLVDEHVKNFHPSFIGLSGSADDIAAAATPFGIFYQQTEGSANTTYLVSHTATVTALDTEGYVRLIFHHGMQGKDMAEDVRQLLGR